MGDNFPMVQLGDVCSKIGSGATPRGGKEVYIDSGVALIRSQNVYNDQFDYSGLAFISDIHAEELSIVVVEENDVLLNITGESVARSYQVPNNILPARVNQHVAIIRPDPESLDPRFLRFFLVSPNMQAHMLSLSSSGGTRKALTKGMIEGFEVPAPDIKIQRRIAYILGTLDDKIELNRRMNETLEGIARAIFKSWFVDFDPVRAKLDSRDTGLSPEIADLFPDSFENSELGKIPRGWGVGKLENLLVLQRGFDLPKRKRKNGKYPLIAASGPSDFHNEYKVKGPGVTTGRSGKLGEVVYIEDDFWPLNTALWVKEFKISKSIHSYFLLKTLNLEQYNAGSAVPTLNRNHIHSLKLELPPIEIIEVFEGKAKFLFRKIFSNTRENETLAELRDTLLPKLMRGEVRV